jgi:hypothetical protein
MYTSEEPAQQKNSRCSGRGQSVSRSGRHPAYSLTPLDLRRTHRTGDVGYPQRAAVAADKGAGRQFFTASGLYRAEATLARVAKAFGPASCMPLDQTGRETTEGSTRTTVPSRRKVTNSSSRLLSPCLHGAASFCHEDVENSSVPHPSGLGRGHRTRLDASPWVSQGGRCRAYSPTPTD